MSAAFIDFVMEKVIRLILDIEDSNHSTVPSYAVIDLGFDILASKNPTIFKPFKGKKIIPNLLSPQKTKVNTSEKYRVETPHKILFKQMLRLSTSSANTDSLRAALRTLA